MSNNKPHPLSEFLGTWSGDDLEELTEQAEGYKMNEWISVKDRLPEDFKEVLYFAITNNGMTKEIMTGHRVNGEWTHCCMFYSTRVLNDLVKVTHWMNLPEYPKD